MILKYKYHSDSGLLEAYRSYTLAQNNSLSDTIVITSTASDADKYNYCLEFICYNSKSIPKAQYISPILSYNDGISFAVPNNLTEFRGHVDLQLTGYDPIDNSIVFKSVSKNCKAFDVEGSLCVLEKDLNDTPNVFTEVLKQLEDLKHIHQDIIDEAMRQYGEKFFEKVANIRWHRVKFYDNGKLIEEKLTCSGCKLNPPQYELPDYCVLVGGWYNPASESLWDFEEDSVEEDIELWLNYMTDDISIEQGVVRSLGSHSYSHIYIPEYFGGYKVTACSKALASHVPVECHVHFCNNMQDVGNFGELVTNSQIAGMYYPYNNPTYVTKEGGYLYAVVNNEYFLIFAPKTFLLRIEQGCSAINSFAIANNDEVLSITLPESVNFLSEFCINNNNALEELTLPSNIAYVDNYAVFNNANLKRIILKGDVPVSLSNESFVFTDALGNVTRPTLYVEPQYYAHYKSLGLEYEIKVLGQEYFDGKYVKVEV